MTELIWEGKYDKGGNKVAPLLVRLPFQTVETVNESAQQRPDNGDKIMPSRYLQSGNGEAILFIEEHYPFRTPSRVGRLVTGLSAASVDCLSAIVVTKQIPIYLGKQMDAKGSLREENRRAEGYH